MFPENPHTATFVCCHVLDQHAPILVAVRDDDEDWQFLCGADHAEADARLVGFGHVLERDPSIRALSELRCGHRAERPNAETGWTITDPHEEFIRRHVKDPGWAVQLIDDDPPFAYSVGLFANYGQPELIVVGLPLELMHAMINSIAERVKAGLPLAPGLRLADVIEGFEVTLRAVKATSSLADHVGYACWFYGKAAFPLFQVVWPDKRGHLPDDPEASDGFKKQQRLLP